MSQPPDIVVGSGPSGVAIAQALLDGGRKVLLVDPGGTLEADRAAKKQYLATHEPKTWDHETLAFLRNPAAGMRVPDKQSFGSSFPYDAPSVATPIRLQHTGLKPSYAVGGLSTVWGGALLPFRNEDMRDWPIQEQDLKEGYIAARRLMPFSAANDDLAAMFPLFGSTSASLEPSRQAEDVLKQMYTQREQLTANGITFGTARLAVNAGACVRCSLCLYGCPHDLIYSARATLDRQRAAGLLYESNVIVKAVSDTRDGVEVRALRPDGSALTLNGARVFLAAGVVNTSEILLRSMGWIGRSVTIKDAQYFLMPVVRGRGIPNVEKEELHTLCQMFIELLDESVSCSTVHLQLYTYNDILRDLVRAKIGILGRHIPLAPLLGRLMVLQGYLHSDESGTIEATLQSPNGAERLSLVGRPSPVSAKAVRRVSRKLSRLRALTGFWPVAPMIEVTEPGRSFHCGGSFPMAREPTAGQTDLIGRPYGFSHVHAVDASVLPSIPATTITFPVMANAYRIGAAALRATAP